MGLEGDARKAGDHAAVRGGVAGRTDRTRRFRAWRPMRPVPRWQRVEGSPPSLLSAVMGSDLPPRLRTRREQTSEARARPLAPKRMAAWTLLVADIEVVREGAVRCLDECPATCFYPKPSLILPHCAASVAPSESPSDMHFTTNRAVLTHCHRAPRVGVGQPCPAQAIFCFEDRPADMIVGVVPRSQGSVAATDAATARFRAGAIGPHDAPCACVIYLALRS